MKKVFLAGGALIALCAVSVTAQPLQYDLYYGLPGEAGSRTVDVGINSSDIGGVGDASLIPVMAKISANEEIEIGVNAQLGLFVEGADALNNLLVGAKYGLGETRAATANILLPMGAANDPGLSVGYMMSREMGRMMVNSQLQLALLDGYTGGSGMGVDLLIEPKKNIGSMIGYLDILIATKTDDIGGDPLAINLGPNVDFGVNESATINGGVIIGLAGDNKVDDVELVVSAIIGL